MSKQNNGGAAFPRPASRGNNYLTGETNVVVDPSEGMSLRQYAAIYLKVPNSGTDWLDEMIVESNRNELAAKAMQGLISDSDWRIDMGASETARAAYDQAHAVLKAREQ